MALRYIAEGIVIVKTHAPIFSESGRVGCTCEAYKRSDKFRLWCEANSKPFDPHYTCPNPGKHPAGNWKQETTGVKESRLRQRLLSTKEREGSMSRRATAAVFNLAQELTAEEFRLLALISEISSDYSEAWLIVDWPKIFAVSRLTAGQAGRILYGLHCDGLIFVGTKVQGAEPLNIRTLRRDFATSDPDLYLHIKGMKATEPEA